MKMLRILIGPIVVLTLTAGIFLTIQAKKVYHLAEMKMKADVRNANASERIAAAIEVFVAGTVKKPKIRPRTQLEILKDAVGERPYTHSAALWFPLPGYNH